MDLNRESFRETFGRDPECLFSAPGRTELGGNHTDHQHGCVVAAAVDLETRALAAKNGSFVIRLVSEGFRPCEVDVRSLFAKPEEKNTPAALVRGIAAAFSEKGADISGMDILCTSGVPVGSGLSSSASFEVLLGTVFNTLFFGGTASPEEIAIIGQSAENTYFGKPCGLMDQMACAVGNVIGIDFHDPKHPVTEKVDFDLSSSGYALCIIDTGASHDGLTEEYAAIPAEMGLVASFFGKEVLRDVKREDLMDNIREVRNRCGDRAVLRAMHFFDENERAQKQLCALRNNDFGSFLSLVRGSGRSSEALLQNITPSGRTDRQEMAFALSLAKELLGSRGAVRVHGGGFAGTIQAFVPLDMLDRFRAGMEDALSKDCCRLLSIRREGAGLVQYY